MSNDLCKSEVEDYIYFPPVLGVGYSDEILWMVPGFEMDLGDPCEFGHVCLCDCSPVYSRVEEEMCDPDEGELEDSLLSMGVATCFNWLNGQAHAQGEELAQSVSMP